MLRSLGISLEDSITRRSSIVPDVVEAIGDSKAELVRDLQGAPERERSAVGRNRAQVCASATLAAKRVNLLRSSLS